MTLVPKGTGLEIEATLPNKNVGFVHKGQDAEIKVEAFTCTRYGLLHGKVTSLSQDAMTPQGAPRQRDGRRDADPENDEEARQAEEASYVARASLDRTAIRPGMSVSTEIKTGRRTIISYILSPLSKIRHDGLTER